MTVCYWCGAKDALADVGKELDDGKYKMVQCSKCKNAYYVVNKEKMNKPKPMTNEEWLRSCPPQELIRFLMNVAYSGHIRNVQKRTFDEEAEKWSKWLKEKHTE